MLALVWPCAGLLKDHPCAASGSFFFDIFPPNVMRAIVERCKHRIVGALPLSSATPNVSGMGTTTATTTPGVTPSSCPPPRPAAAFRSVRNQVDPWSSPAHAAKNPFRILSLDGGGVRGVITLVMLARLEDKFPKFIKHNVDLIAGTSTGGLIGLLLAAGYSAKETLEIYKTWIPRIFDKPSWLWGITGAKYSSENRQKACELFFGQRTLGDLEKHVMVTTFNLSATNNRLTAGTHWHPTLLTTLPRCNGRIDPDSTVLASDAAMRTSAAPTYFPVHQGFVDGAVCASNPALMAFARVLESYPHVSRRGVRVLSLSCGDEHAFMPTNGKGEDDWGLAEWGPHIHGLLLSGQATATEAALTMMLGEWYHRARIPLSSAIALDDHSAVDKLVEIAEAVPLACVEAFLGTNFGCVPAPGTVDAAAASLASPDSSASSSGSSNNNRASHNVPEVRGVPRPRAAPLAPLLL